MPRGPSPVSSCVGKSPFATQMQAQAAIGRRRKNQKSRAPLRAYHCPLCRLWHVGGRDLRKPKLKPISPTETEIDPL